MISHDCYQWYVLDIYDYHILLLFWTNRNINPRWDSPSFKQCYRSACCVFWPANECSACGSLVEIICFWVKTSFYACFSCYFLCFTIYFLPFFPFVMKKMKKLVLKQKQIILTSKRHAEHLFSSQNTQQVSLVP